MVRVCMLIHSSTLSSNILHTLYLIFPHSLLFQPSTFSLFYIVFILSPHHTYDLSSPHFDVIDLLPYPFVLPAQPLCYVGIVYHIWVALVPYTYGPPASLSSTPIVYYISSAPFHQSWSSPFEFTPASFI